MRVKVYAFDRRYLGVLNAPETIAYDLDSMLLYSDSILESTPEGKLITLHVDKVKGETCFILDIREDESSLNSLTLFEAKK